MAKEIRLREHGSLFAGHPTAFALAILGYSTVVPCQLFSLLGFAYVRSFGISLPRSSD